MQMRAEIRGAGLFGRGAVERAKRLRCDQPLILSREPLNHSDPNAIQLWDIFDAPVGFVAREVAAVVAPSMDRGDVWMAKVIIPAGTVQHRGDRPRWSWPVALLQKLYGMPQAFETTHMSGCHAATGRLF